MTAQQRPSQHHLIAEFYSRNGRIRGRFPTVTTLERASEPSMPLESCSEEQTKSADSVPTGAWVIIHLRMEEVF